MQWDVRSFCGLFQLVIILINTLPGNSNLRSLSECHDDFTLNPRDGYLDLYTFSWLGLLQYVHVVTGVRSLNKAPRVVLIHKQFVLAASNDVKYLPLNYKLGNVIIDDYERTELECGLTVEQIKNELRCPRAVLEIPTVKVIYHPENSRFQVHHSLALIKLLTPVKSQYLLPICLPSTAGRRRLKKVKRVFLVDFTSLIPINFADEIKAKKTFQLLDEEECSLIRKNLTLMKNEKVFQILCTSGCGIRSGSPIVTHSADGSFELVGISVGGGACKNILMRDKLIQDPPIYVDIYPYKKWVINVITANLIPKAIPNFIGESSFRKRHNLRNPFLTRASQKEGWRGRWYASGDACFKPENDFKKDTYQFYLETFLIKNENEARVNYLLQLSAGYGTIILCAKMKMPQYRTDFPTVTGLGTHQINVSFDTKWFPAKFELVIGLFGRDSSDAEFSNFKSGDKKASKFWN